MFFWLMLFGEPLQLAVASNFRHTLEPLVEKFEINQGVTVHIVYGSSGKLMAQIVHGAPYDLFLSADKEHVQYLVDRKLVDASTRTIYAQGILVLWWMDAADQQAALLGKVAIANPKLAPYGKAAEQFLTKVAAKPSLIFAENVGQVAHFVLSGNVDAGFCSLAQVKAVGKGHFWALPQHDYAPIFQEAVIIKNGGMAQAFLSFLVSPIAQNHIQKSGYRPAP